MSAQTPELVAQQPHPEHTLGDLLMSAQADANAREHNRQVADRVAARSSLEAFHLRVQAAAFEAFDPWASIPAALRLRAYTNREYGQDLTPEAVRRVRGRVCEVLDIDTAAADALPLTRIAEVLHEADRGAEPSDATTGYRWLRVRQVASLFDLNPGVVSKHADAGIFVTNGRSGFDRRIDVLSVVRRELARLGLDDAAE